MVSRKTAERLLGVALAGFLLAGCGTPALVDEQGLSRVALHSVDGGRVETCDVQKTVQMRYHGRPLEMDVRRFAQIRLDARAQQTTAAGKRLFFERLSVPLDLSREQWPEVFSLWFHAVCRLPGEVVLSFARVTMNGQPVWQTTFAAPALNADGSRWGRVYLFTHGRQAIVLRTVGWTPRDIASWRGLLDEMAASIEAK